MEDALSDPDEINQTMEFFDCDEIPDALVQTFNQQQDLESYIPTRRDSATEDPAGTK